jgi:hypothetical protein
MQGRAGRVAIYVHIAARQGKIKKGAADNGDMWTRASPSRAAKVWGAESLDVSAGAYQPVLAAEE